MSYSMKFYLKYLIITLLIFNVTISYAVNEAKKSSIVVPQVCNSMVDFAIDEELRGCEIHDIVVKETSIITYPGSDIEGNFFKQIEDRIYICLMKKVKVHINFRYRILKPEHNHGHWQVSCRIEKLKIN